MQSSKSAKALPLGRLEGMCPQRFSGRALGSRSPSRTNATRSSISWAVSGVGWAASVILSLLWGWWLDGRKPDVRDVAGGLICLIGVAVIMYAPRG